MARAFRYVCILKTSMIYLSKRSMQVEKPFVMLKINFMVIVLAYSATLSDTLGVSPHTSKISRLKSLKNVSLHLKNSLKTQAKIYLYLFISYPRLNYKILLKLISAN